MSDRNNGRLRLVRMPRPGIVLARVIKNSVVHVTVSFKISSKHVPHMRALPLMCTFPSGDSFLTIVATEEISYLRYKMIICSTVESKAFFGERPSGKAFATMSWR